LIEQEEIRHEVMTGEVTSVIRSRLYQLEKTESVTITKRNDISTITASNHATLEEVKEVENKGVDVAAEEVEDVVDEELLI
jgi:uncharacterized protein YnzC (UPF0291/DUF896 family)